MDQKPPRSVSDEEMGSDKPLKPVLQKPPGLREPDAAPKTTPFPRRRPMPMYPEKKRGRSCCRIFYCCFCIVFIVILLLLSIAVAVFFLWYNPKLPVVRLASFKITTFNFSTTAKSDDGWSFLTSDSTVLLDFRNPNGKLGFHYGEADVDVILGEKDFETNLGSTKVEAFVETPGNRTAVIVPMKVRKRQVDDSTAKRLRTELKSKTLLVKVTAKTKVGLAVGSRKILTVGVSIKCGGVRLQSLDSQMAKCTIQMFKWIILRT